MEFREEEDRICLLDPQGKTLAEVTFVRRGEGWELNHTFVDPSLAGQGVGGRLVEAAARRLRREGKQARITCSYAAHWLEKHPQWADVVEKD